ncbi:dihydrolipoamide acetyltransferase component of pyruvate dehydrogenase complex [Nocardioides flavus (ex Wang et al. 2016)]|uniref:Dihydrolipoamide acetyltransferase component of pyruvate dehydrogenase complex n=1 Tax=Nocardioides flavus (ex Wang et al. 2016) TaxID=2058780 RepID=A0ABQ3HF66_9ACTN|nr:dihydrolipoamide acetyltransferase family protein [Nocardioides flavus (ex Wang et al. 2016)]GHE15318.1 dihydrolipoamide acetyltransferase component of pyruvate dehydrogenase complex [Nocardioides flavus (ex Wang et al. 2016)]
MSEFLLPDVGEGLTEAEIVAWKVKVGDTVEINDVIVEIETAKSLVELPSPFEGTVLALLVAEGETIPVGTPIISIGAEGDAPTPSAAPAAEQTESDPYLGMAQKAGQKAGAAEVSAQVDAADIDLSNPAASGSMEGASLVGRIKAERGPMRRARRGSASPSTVAGGQTQMQVQGAFSPGGAQSDEVMPADEAPVPAVDQRPAPAAAPAEALVPPTAQEPGAVRALAKPPVRKLAKDLGVDLTALTGSGPSGSITRDDVQGAANGSGGRSMPQQYADLAGSSDGRAGVAPMAGARETREPIKGVRKMMATAMSQSAFTSPHVTEWITVDVTATMQLVERLKARRELAGVRINPLLVLARAVLMAMKRTPEINSYWDEAAQEVVYKGYVNLGIAAATPRGLVVPNVKDADAMSMVELAGALGELTATARDGKTQPAEMSGGTFTITNVGVFGVDAGTPIINPGESAILCFGAINKRPWVDEATGEIVVRDVTTLALSFDHRHIDGEKGSRFLADVAGILQDPGTALLF